MSLKTKHQEKENEKNNYLLKDSNKRIVFNEILNQARRRVASNKMMASPKHILTSTVLRMSGDRIPMEQEQEQEEGRMQTPEPARAEGETYSSLREQLRLANEETARYRQIAERNVHEQPAQPHRRRQTWTT